MVWASKLLLALVAIAATAVFPAIAQIPTSLPEFCRAKSPEAIRKLVTAKLSCGFDRRSMSYAGTPIEQARCLLRNVRIRAKLDPPRDRLPAPLERLVGAKVTISPSKFEHYLKTRGISASEVGGDLDTPLSSTNEGRAAAYFVIHDTSTPNYGAADFPADIDKLSWRFNQLAARHGNEPAAHMYIARTGESLSTLGYSTPWRATKAESCVLLARSRGLFLHNELIQPRRSDPQGRRGNDNFAPGAPFKPFTDGQMDRLALAYVAASIRAKRWLIPAYHVTIDEGLGDGHDDPQGFDLDNWAERVDSVARAAEGG